MKVWLLVLFFPISILFADVSRFIDSIDFSSAPVKTRIITKSSALISSQPATLRSYNSNQFVTPKTITLHRETLEKRLGESISHRYQASGTVIAFLTREWTPIKVSSSYLIKISDCSPDELSSSTFVRFGVWDGGNLIGEFAEPLRVGQYVDVFYSKTPLLRGVRMSSVQFDQKPVDILKQHAGAVPVSANVKGYQLASNIKSNTPIKWNFLSKITLVKKGQIVDVFASGNGIYVTMKGMALENGVEGGNVTVQNLSSDKKFQAKVLNENSVKVHL
ncbi:MAG: flagellar basal body P-ring formation protein FlgA [Opitutae bacterium]|nr:flagellar basal body P-ring formation protein FlgA [Opitutae bacterium]MBT5717506.1 flagellar basal body P-ring formation protein FlgA [Opitutae bacterium]